MNFHQSENHLVSLREHSKRVTQVLIPSEFEVMNGVSDVKEMFRNFFLFFQCLKPHMFQPVRENVLVRTSKGTKEEEIRRS
jgi:hypothetical protein